MAAHQGGSSQQLLEVGIWPDSLYEVCLDDYHHPIYVLGVPGMGKSVLLGNLALQLNQLGEGILLIDVKDGQLARDVAERADPARLQFVAPGLCNFDGRLHHWGLNVIELSNRDRLTLDVVIDNLMSMFERMDRADYSIMTQLRLHLDMAVRLSLYAPEPTLLTVYDVLTVRDFRKFLYTKPLVNPTVAKHWIRFDDKSQITAFAQSTELRSTLARIEEMITPANLYYMVGQPITTMRIADWLNEGKLVVVDCASGMSNKNSELLGNLVLALAMHATFMRPYKPTPNWRLICDEFDKLAGNNFADLITKARSYNVFPVMAHQNLDQLKRDRDKAQTLYNAASGVPIVFRLALTDEDRRTVKTLIGETEATAVHELNKYEARLFVRSGIPGLLDSSRNATIRLQDWGTHPVPGQYEWAVESQRPFTTAESQLRERIKPDETNQILQPTQKRRSSPGRPEPLPEDDSPATRPSFVPGTSFRKGNKPE